MPSEFNHNVLSEAKLDPYLAQLLGNWTAESHIAGERKRFSAKGEAVLNGAYVSLSMHEFNEPRKNASLLFIGRTPNSDKYYSHWLFSAGAGEGSGIGSGTLDGNTLLLTYPADDGTQLVRLESHRDGSFDIKVMWESDDDGSTEEISNFRFSQELE